MMYKLRYKTSLDTWDHESQVYEKWLKRTDEQVLDKILSQFPWYELYQNGKLVQERKAFCSVTVDNLTFFCTSIEEVNYLQKIFPKGEYETFDTTECWGY